MLEQTRKREQLLHKQSQTREATLKSAEVLEQWLSDAENIVATSLDSMIPLNNKNFSESVHISQWNLDKLEQQRNVHETFCNERLLQGAELLESMNQCFESFVEVWPIASVTEATETEMAICTKEVLTKVEDLRRRYNVSGWLLIWC